MVRNYITIFILITFLTQFPGQAFSQYSDSTRKDSIELKHSESIYGHPNRRNFKSFIPGIAAVGYGVIALANGPLKNFDHYIADKRNERRPNFQTSADDYIRYAPFVAFYGLDLIGVKGKHNFVDKTGVLVLSGIFVAGSVKVLKKWTDKERPDHSDQVSFPSGHAAIAFAGAELINQEYGDISPWYSVAGYTVASATAVLRVYNNAHWFSDVVAGAGVGILSTKLAYLVYPPIKRLVSGNKNVNFTMVPSYQNGAVGIAIAGKF